MTSTTEGVTNRHTGLNLDDAYCDQCGRGLFEMVGMETPAGDWQEWSISTVRQFLAASECAYYDCNGRPLVPAWRASQAQEDALDG